MPELPEVETVRRGLVPILEGALIERVEILDPRLVQPAAPVAIERLLGGRRVIAIGRRGKYLLLELDDDLVAVHHLRMTGAFIDGVPGEPDPVTHVRLRYHVAGHSLCYRDPRRFGTLSVGSTSEVAAYLAQRLGPEPLDPAAFTPSSLHASLHRRSAPVKAVLLDQRVVAGLGNIYVDEALFLAGIDPRSRSDAVSRPAAGRLHDAIVARLEEAIVAGGSTLRDYRAVNGASGSMQERFHVYGRTGQACSTCGGLLRGDRIAGRGTTWCGRCQRLMRSSLRNH